MKKIKLAAIAVAGLLAGGCATVEMSSPGSLKGVDVKGAGGKADRAIMVANEGYYLFQAWPLVAGDVTWIAGRNEIDGSPVFFSEELEGDKMLNAIGKYANSRDCDLVDLVIVNRCECKIGLFGLLDWFNTVVGYQGGYYSGVLRSCK